MPIGRQDKHKHFRIKVSLFPFYFFNKSTEKTHETLAICEYIYYFCTEKPTNEEIMETKRTAKQQISKANAQIYIRVQGSEHDKSSAPSKRRVISKIRKNMYMRGIASLGNISGNIDFFDDIHVVQFSPIVKIQKLKVINQVQTHK